MPQANPLDPDRLCALLARVGLGERAAFRSLYDACAPKLFAIAVRILRDDARAEEVVQDSFVNIWNGAAGYNRSLAAPMTWMITIVRNRSMDYFRRDDRTEALDDDLLAVIESSQPGPADHLQLSEDSAVLHACMRRLEPPQRQVIALAYFHGASHSELASDLDIPIGTVKTWIRRGLERLRRCIDGGGKD